jgi:ATP-dependent DNA ligase
MAHNRTRLLARVESQIPGEFVKYAPTLYTSNSVTLSALEDEVREVEGVYRKALADGYEGLIMRLDTPYNNVNRKSMYKLKELITEEFRVIGFTEGTGKMEKTIMYICELTDKSKQMAMEYLQARNRTWESSDTKFNVTPMGSLDERRDMFKLMHRYEDDGRKHFDVHYRNRLYTVQFNNWSKFLKPMCPIGVGFREF